VLDRAFVRFMEIQIDFFREGLSASQNYQSIIDNYRKRFPRTASKQQIQQQQGGATQPRVQASGGNQYGPTPDALSPLPQPVIHRGASQEEQPVSCICISCWPTSWRMADVQRLAATELAASLYSLCLCGLCAGSVEHPCKLRSLAQPQHAAAAARGGSGCSCGRSCIPGSGPAAAAAAAPARACFWSAASSACAQASLARR